MSTTAGACCSLWAKACKEMSVETDVCHFQSVSDSLFTHLCMSLNVWVNSKQHVFLLVFSAEDIKSTQVCRTNPFDWCFLQNKQLFIRGNATSQGEWQKCSVYSLFFPPLPTQCAKGTHYDNRPLDSLQAISASMLITSHSYLVSNLINMSV